MAYWIRRSSSSAQVAGDEDDDYQKWSRDPDKRRSRQHHASDNSDNSANRRSLSTSVTAFFSRLRPSRRPERGFSTSSHRRHNGGVWNDLREYGNGSASIAARLMMGETTSKHILSTSEVHESDTIPAELWNTAIPIPRRTHSITGSRPTRRSMPVSAAGQIQHHNINREINPRHGPLTTGLTCDGASIVPARKPHRSAAIGRASSVPPRSVSAQASPASDRARQLFLAKQEARRQRQALKESGDFLGVTGFNPQTGELDILTPTTSSEEGISPETPYLTELARKAQEAQVAYEQAKREAQTRRNQDKKETKSKEKEALRLEQQPIKWRREEGQWSSVAEPRLSPIPQSRRNSGAAHSSDSTTVRHEHGSFLGMGAAPGFTVTPTRCRRASSETIEAPIPQADQSPNLQPIQQSGNQWPVTSSPRRRRTIRLSIPPIIPRRLGHCQQNTSPPPKEESTPRGPSLELELENQCPAERWASTLLQDLDGLERSIEAHSREITAREGSRVQNIVGLGEATGSVCTPTTTTTGSVLSPRLYNVCGETVATLQDTRPEAVSTSAHTRSRLSETSMNGNSYSNPLAFRPPMQPSAWLSLPNLPVQTATECMNGSQGVELVETEEPKQRTRTGPPSPSSAPHGDTTWGRAYTMPIMFQKPFLASWLMNSHQKKEIRKTMRAPEEQQEQRANNTSRLTSTSMQKPSPLRRSSSRRTSELELRRKVQAEERELRQLSQAMAQGAARQAFAQHVPQLRPGTGPVSDHENEKVVHGTGADTRGGAGTGASSGHGGVRGVAKTVMGAEAGHDSGNADLAGTVSWGPLVPVLFRVTSASNVHQMHDGDMLMMIRAQPQQTNQNKENKRQKVPQLISRQLQLLAPPQDWDDLFPVRLRKVTSLIRQLVCAYWKLVRPVFDADSPLRQRLEQSRRATGEDYGICVLALGFLILAASAGAWTIKILVGVFHLIGVLIRVFLVLAGFV